MLLGIVFMIVIIIILFVLVIINLLSSGHYMLRSSVAVWDNI